MIEIESQPAITTESAIEGFEEIAGESVAFETEGGALIVDTYLRDPVIFIDMKAAFDPVIDGRVKGLSTGLQDGSALPEWVREIRPGFFAADPPSYTGNVELLLNVSTQDRDDQPFGLSLDCRTGGISMIEDVAGKAA